MCKRVLSLFIAALMIFGLTACGETFGGVPDMTGNWTEVDPGDGMYHVAVIQEDTIEVYWVSETINALYWAGTFAASSEEETNVWHSMNDTEKTQMSILSSGEETKTFTYEDGKLSYEVSAFGVTSVVELKRTSDEVLRSDSAVDVKETEETGPVETVKGFDENAVLSQMEITEYSYIGEDMNYGILTVKNNSEYDLSIYAAGTFLNEEGEFAGACSASADAVESGTETILIFVTDKSFVDMEYELAVSAEEWYGCVVSNLSYESAPAKNKEIVSITNNGSEAAEYVQAHALFFKGEELVGYADQYFTDKDDEIKPGETISEEMECCESYDSVKFFFTGRSSEGI